MSATSACKEEKKMKHLSGLIIAVIAAILWGFSGTCAQYIFAVFHLDPSHLTAIRMVCAGFILILVGFLVDRKNMTAIWKEKKAAARLLLFSVFGIMLCQLSYLQAIAYSNSGTATTLQYIGPVIIMGISCITARRLPEKKEALAICLAVFGVFLIATHGNITNLVITRAGLFWGLMAAATLASYTLIPQKIIKKFGSIPVTGYGMTIGGAVLFFLSRSWEAGLPSDGRFWWAFGVIVIFGTVLAFTLFLKGSVMVGPVKASMIASLEPVSATVTMILLLGEPFHFIEGLGFLSILATVFLLIKK